MYYYKNIELHFILLEILNKNRTLKFKLLEMMTIMSIKFTLIVYSLSFMHTRGLLNIIENY